MVYQIETLGQGEKIRISSNPVYSYPTHIHTYCEMILYEPFDGEITVNAQQIRPDSCCVILISPLDLHRVWVRKDGGARFIKVELIAEKAERSAIVKDVASNGFLRHIFEELLCCGQDESYANLLTMTALHIIHKEGQTIPPIADSPANHLAMEAVKMVYQNYCKPITLGTVAKELFVSPQYLSKVFKNMVGVGFSQFLSELRLKHAAYLLTSTVRPITSICFECGFGNLSHFLRRFKQSFGVNPSDYRENAKNSHNK